MTQAVRAAPGALTHGEQMPVPPWGQVSGMLRAQATPPSSDFDETDSTSERTFVRGIPTTPVDAVDAWMTSKQVGGKPRLLRLPMFLERGTFGFSAGGAGLGNGPDALEVYCDDLALGIGLAERARQLCDGKQVCALWLEGYWRGSVRGQATFAVTWVEGPIEAVDEPTFTERAAVIDGAS
jgi:hypothetical protein